MKKISLLIFFLSAIFLQLSAQEETKDISETGFIATLNHEGGKVTITQDARLQSVVNNHILANKSRPTMGWRVQIYFGQGQAAKTKAENVKKSFLKKYPEMRAYLIYEAPYFKVRVGNFKTKFEAMKMQKELENKYDKVFVIEDEIDLYDRGEETEEDDGN